MYLSKEILKKDPFAQQEPFCFCCRATPLRIDERSDVNPLPTSPFDWRSGPLPAPESFAPKSPKGDFNWNF
jgi:hypothetical protein